MRFSCLKSTAWLLRAQRRDSLEPGLAQRVPCGTPASFREILGVLRRVHLEIHPQRLRLQHTRQHPDCISGCLGAIENSWICWARERTESTWILRAYGVLQRGRAVFLTASRRSRRYSLR